MKALSAKQLERKLSAEGWRIDRLPGEPSLWDRGRKIPPGFIEVSRYRAEGPGIAWAWLPVRPEALERAREIRARWLKRWNEIMG